MKSLKYLHYFVDPEDNNNVEEAPTETSHVNETTTDVRRSSRNHQYTKRYLAHRQSLGCKAAVTSTPNIEDVNKPPVEPSSYMKATTGPDAEHWIPAISDEYDP